MANWEEGLRKVILAGVGAAAATAEKGQELLHELVQKGASTVEEGKVRNEELKHDLKERVKEHVTITAVSYTHLDVYKRQCSGTSSHSAG